MHALNSFWTPFKEGLKNYVFQTKKLFHQKSLFCIYFSSVGHGHQTAKIVFKTTQKILQNHPKNTSKSFQNRFQQLLKKSNVIFQMLKREFFVNKLTRSLKDRTLIFDPRNFGLEYKKWLIKTWKKKFCVTHFLSF